MAVERRVGGAGGVVLQLLVAPSAAAGIVAPLAGVGRAPSAAIEAIRPGQAPVDGGACGRCPARGGCRGPGRSGRGGRGPPPPGFRLGPRALRPRGRRRTPADPPRPPTP